MRRKNLLCALVILINPLFYRWDYDILTSISRTFICGFVFAFIGVNFICNNEKKNKIKALFAPVLMAIAYINTETTITVIALGILFAVLYKKETLRVCWYELIEGMTIAVIICKFCNSFFYKVNSEYVLHGGESSVSFSVDVLKQNFVELKRLLSAFSVINIVGFPIILIIIIVCIFAVPFFIKEWKLLLLDVCALGGTVLFLALPKTRDFYDQLLFSQTRMFLFIAYVVVILIYFTGHVAFEKNYFNNLCKKKIIYYSFIVVALVLLVGKIYYFETIVLEKKDLYQSTSISVADVESMYAAADTISECALDNNCSIVVLLTDNRVLGYATGAINYDQYISYNAFYDRRTSTYLDLKENNIKGNVLFVNTEGNVVSDFYVKYIDGNLIEWIRENLNIQRYPEWDLRYIHE